MKKLTHLTKDYEIENGSKLVYNTLTSLTKDDWKKAKCYSYHCNKKIVGIYTYQYLYSDKVLIETIGYCNKHLKKRKGEQHASILKLPK